MKVTSKNYDGKLYIKLGRKYIPLEQDIVYFEQLENSIMQLRKQIEKIKNCSNCNGIIKGGIRAERCKSCIKNKDFRYWEPAE